MIEGERYVTSAKAALIVVVIEGDDLRVEKCKLETSINYQPVSELPVKYEAFPNLKNLC